MLRYALKVIAVTGTVWLGIAFVEASQGVAGFSSPPVASRPPVYNDDFKDVIRLVRITVLGAKPNAHVWQIIGDTDTAYASLYSPELRKRLCCLPKRTRVAEGISSAAIVAVPGAVLPDPDRRERKDFEVFCGAHGLRFIVLPIA